jgi:hypothetical protein
MKTLKLLLLVLLLHSQAFSQVSRGYFFPMGVMGITYGDSLLNTSAVLKAAGIRKITSVQTSKSDLKTGFSPITTYLNANSKIEKVVYCMPRPGKTPPIICMNDTIFYDSSGRMLRTVSKDASGLAYLQVDADYSVGGKVKYTLVYSNHQQPRNDTDISYHYYNERGQLVGLVYAYGDQRKLTPLSATVYYNADGLPDSIRHDNPAIGTYIFKRIQKRNTKQIILETTTHYYGWMYNASGQCISSQMGSKKRNTASLDNQAVYYTESSATYKYNDDGTLAKVLIERDRKKVAALSYSYEK